MYHEIESRFVYSKLSIYTKKDNEYEFFRLIIEFLSLALTINYEFSLDKSKLKFFINAFMFGNRFRKLKRLNQI